MRRLIPTLSRHVVDVVMMEQEAVRVVESLAKRWMPGNREGSENRPAWAHPADVVEIVQQLPGVRPNPDTQWYLEAVAWGHDLLEDGVKEDGGRVTADDLRDAGVPDHVVLGIQLVTKRGDQTEMGYWRQIEGAPELVKIVKCCDRIANLREGARTQDDQWWSRYVSKTRRYILTHLPGMGQPWRNWLAVRLEEAMASRPTVRISGKQA